MITQSVNCKDQSDSVKLKPTLKERAYRFGLDIIGMIDLLAKDMSCKVIGNQLLRSATSIGANIIEARASSSKKDFTNFFTHALKSANESIFWLELLRDSKKSGDINLESLIKEAKELANILGASILTLKGKNKV